MIQILLNNFGNYNTNENSLVINSLEQACKRFVDLPSCLVFSFEIEIMWYLDDEYIVHLT